MRDRLRRLVDGCGFTRYASPTYQPIVPRLSDVVPTKAEREATAALQAETALMVSTEPHGVSVMEQLNRDWISWPGIEEAERRAGAAGASSHGEPPDSIFTGTAGIHGETNP